MMILAFSGVGKTSIACNIALNDPMVPTVFFSWEMSAHMLMQRMAAIHTGTPTAWVESHSAQGSAGEMQRLIVDFPNLLIHDDESASLSDMDEIVDEAAEMLHQDVRLILVDYLELVRVRAMGGTDAVDAASRGMRRLARRKQAALVVLHQLSLGSGRMGEGYEDHGHRPLSTRSARYGGTAPMDYVLGAYRPGLNPQLPPQLKVERESEMKIQLLKTRAMGGLDPLGQMYRYDTSNCQVTHHSASLVYSQQQLA